jgi:hypothetical protein
MIDASVQRTVGVELILPSVTLVLRLVGLVDDSCIVDDTLRIGDKGDSSSSLLLLDETAAGVTVVS